MDGEPSPADVLSSVSYCMSEENVLQLELEKLDIPALKRVAQVWNIQKLGKDKKAIVKSLTAAMNDAFYVRGILEKLSATQVVIYTSILKSKKNILTLGEISRKINLPPVNTEMELGVLKRYFLVYQRKNRERLTNNLDKYYYYPESGAVVRMETNEKGEKFRTNLAKTLEARDAVPDAWARALGQKKGAVKNFNPALLAKTTTDEVLEKVVASLPETERELLLECFLQGGVLEISRARELIAAKKGKWEDTLRKMNLLALLQDDYYIDEKFVRVLTMPVEVFAHLQTHPLLPIQKKGTKKRQEKVTGNDLDFFLNLKKMIVYVSRKGLNLAKSGKLKQIDLKETENRLLRPDIGLFIEKSEIYQIELLLPVMRLLDIVRVKRDDIVLRNDFDKILEQDPFRLMQTVITEIAEARNRRIQYEDVFEPLYVPFYKKEILDECVAHIMKKQKILYFVIIATMVREKLVMAKSFKIKNFQQELADLRKELTSALFYLQLLGLVSVEYPDRQAQISALGLHHFKGQPLKRDDEKGAIIINPDMSLIAIPEKLSLRGLYILKSFCELKSHDNIYTFQITRESFQEGILLKNDVKEFVDLLRTTSKNELSQNLLFSIEDWSNSLPLVTITDECVVVQTQDSRHMELLLGQISGKKIVVEKISPTTILIDGEKIPEAIAYAEKLNLIVRLIR